MVRISLTICLLAGSMNLGLAARAANAPGAKSPKLERIGDHIFQLADVDKSGALNATEQVQADMRAEKAIRQLIHDNTIGGPNRLVAVAEPQLGNADAMTRQEFAQHFAALAARKDTELRACRIAKNQTCTVQPSAYQNPVFVTIHEPVRDRFHDDHRSRDRRDYFNDRSYSSPKPVWQPQPQPQPIASPPGHRDTPAPAHHEAGGGRHDAGGGHHDSGGKLEPPHGHDSPKGGSHGPGGHHGK